MKMQPGQQQPSRKRILFLDAYDSFSNNITSLLQTLLDVEVSVLHIDSPSLFPWGIDSTPDEEAKSRFVKELARYDAVVCGPGPGNPGNQRDVGVMRFIWELEEGNVLPVLGICLGFQSLVNSCQGGQVKRLRRGLHGMVRTIIHRMDSVAPVEGDIFAGVNGFKATLYHSLCGHIGQEGIDQQEWEEARWQPQDGCPELLPLAWVEEQREEGEGFEAGTERILMAVKHRTKPFWGVQYHPESVCTEEEGNKIIVNWFEEALGWNQKHKRTTLVDGHNLAEAAIKPSLLSQLTPSGEPRASGQWWEKFESDPVLRSVSVPLPRGIQVPDIVEAVDPDASERIILDSANAAPAKSSADVRGRCSIIAAGLDEALRLEYHAGDDYATTKLKAVGGMSVNLSQQVPIARYGSIWALIAAFQDARHIDVEGPETTPFLGGFMGYVTYEQGLMDIGINLDHPRPHHRPDVCLSWITKSIVIDHLAGVVHVQHLRSSGSEEDTWLEKTTGKLLTLQNIQRRPSFNSKKDNTQLPQSPTKRRPSRSTTSIQTPLTKEYEDKVRLCQEHIAAGESYELCLTDQTTITRPLSDVQPPLSPTQPKHPRLSSSPATRPNSWSLFKHLRIRQPAPFASYLRLHPATLVSASPERFLTYDRQGKCSMRPMKGTVRKSDICSTLSQAENILHVPKEEAENLMIVDLVRHDLHSICGAGNVTVRDLLKVEEYQSVFQMITVVEGQLPRQGGYGGLDALAGALPPGSMTGAPKRRSCEILRGVEGGRERGLYSGVVGYHCVSGRGDWSVTIRSLFRWDDEVGREGGEEEVWRIGAGGAVTILSTEVGEREEMFTKLAGPLRVFGEVC